ncbi:MAG: hypothetical protein ABI687_13325 [Flavitalea sp.]
MLVLVCCICIGGRSLEKLLRSAAKEKQIGPECMTVFFRSRQDDTDLFRLQKYPKENAEECGIGKTIYAKRKSWLKK